MSLHIFEYFLDIFLKVACLCYYDSNRRRNRKNSKSSEVLFLVILYPIIPLCQTQTGATVPLSQPAWLVTNAATAQVPIWSLFWDSSRRKERQEKPIPAKSISLLGIFIVCCNETTLTGEPRFHISTPLGIEPRSLMTGSKLVDHWTSGTVCQCSEIAGSTQGSPPAANYVSCEAGRRTCSKRQTRTGKLCEINWDYHNVGTMA